MGQIVGTWSKTWGFGWEMLKKSIKQHLTTTIYCISTIVYGGAPLGMEFYVGNVLHSRRGKGQQSISFGAKIAQ